ncbi:SAM-dependent methyltransferase [Rhodococcus sp. BP22]|uniref:SAM-dependent methyltransferase n=1 Tax=Rhodococcus sp. BP22 TaxID=2758566 RepID=UPI0037C889AD
MTNANSSRWARATNRAPTGIWRPRRHRADICQKGCGRGRIAHHLATLTGGQVSGYNIDPNQLENADEWAARCGISDRLHFKFGDHHKPLDYESESFDGCFSGQSV